MRKGQNPVKLINQVAKPNRVTAAVLNHIPFLDGFYTNLLDVLKLSLSTLRENAGMPFDLLIYDNGSCSEARQFLLAEFEKQHVQTLILADRNMGKGGAWNVMLQAAPGEIIAYADNDVLYHKDWLKESIKYLETFPNVGMLTSRPFHTRPELYQAVLGWAQNASSVVLEKGHFVEPRWNREFLLSVGRTEAEILADNEIEDVRITFQGLTAYAGASHWQFLAWKHILQEFLPIDLSKPLGQVLKLDEMVDQRGYLRIMTDQPYVMNLSNTTEIPSEASRNSENTQQKPRFVDLPIIKSPLMRIYNAIFSMYYKK